MLGQLAPASTLLADKITPLRRRRPRLNRLKEVAYGGVFSDARKSAFHGKKHCQTDSDIKPKSAIFSGREARAARGLRPTFTSRDSFARLAAETGSQTAAETLREIRLNAGGHIF